jgi:hypothetical protein
VILLRFLPGQVFDQRGLTIVTLPTPLSTELPAILAGPVLRRLSPDRILIWLVTSQPLVMTLSVQPEGGSHSRHGLSDGDAEAGKGRGQILSIGRHAHVQLLDYALPQPLPVDQLISYDLLWTDDAGEQSLAAVMPELRYPGQETLSFVIPSSNRQLLHGSCRKPHFAGKDGLVRADEWLGERLLDSEQRLDWLLMTGDQVYADDVAGPMLVAIHRLIERLGLYDEKLEGATVDDSQALYQSDKSYYQREQLLPDVQGNLALRERFFGGVKKPVFTSTHARNHLMTLSEVLAMYLLVWSPVPWRLIDRQRKPVLAQEQEEAYREEQEIINDFVDGLPQVARLLAHMPSLMIFDDHDVTDDWNLTADWESTAYGHPFSRRIIGNALVAYLLCQAWGNDPDRVSKPLAELESLLGSASQSGWLDAAAQDATIDNLLRFHAWEYQVPGTPHLIVLDTRTRRWRSERSPGRPSGLMDWESLTEMQQRMLDKKGVVIVSPAPMFGVKLIEGVQKLFTLAGKPLLVDAENWMAHRGAAKVMLNIFRHSRTPGNFVVLSGDVHYSYVYDIRIRHRDRGPHIWQITSSGLKNAFPETLLDWFDRLNRWLYAPWSPLNWLTKRRRMQITPRDPDQASSGERVWNGTGIGLVIMDQDGRPIDVRQLDARGMDVSFPKKSS